MVKSDSKGGSRGDKSGGVDRKGKLMEKAPVLPFGFDLESWENPNAEGPLVLK